MLQIVFFDNHLMYSEGFVMAFGDQFDIRTVDTGEALFDTLADRPADMVVIGVNRCLIKYVDITRQLRSEYPDVKILVIASNDVTKTVQSMRDIGIDGFTGKRHAGKAVLENAIRKVAAGEGYSGELDEYYN